MDSADHSPIPAPYGRACMNCAKAKTRCMMPDVTGAQCERCRRLHKQCQPSLVVRKRKPGKTQPATKTARLEEKLDGLVSLLQNAAQPISGVPDRNMDATHIQSYESSLSLRTNLLDNRRNCPEASQDPNPMGFEASVTSHQQTPGSMKPNITSPASTSNPYIPSGFDISTAEAEQNLQTFRTHNLKHFPFLNISPSTTSDSLRHQRPFLWFCIMTICSTSLSQHLCGELEIRSILGRQILLEGDRNLDLLQGILIHIAWGQSHRYKMILSAVMQLATSVLGDLGLQRNPPKEPPYMMLDYDARGCPRPFNPSVRTMEERRVALVCFLHSSTISAYFQKIDPPRWTAYLDTCLQMLIDNKEDLDDALLALIVRLRLIVERNALAPWHLDGSADLGVQRTSIMFFVRTLEAQLEDIKRNIPEALAGNETLLLHLHHTTISIHEISLSRSSYLLSQNSATIPPSNTYFPAAHPTTNLDHLSSLSSCLCATKSWFTTFLSFPSSAYSSFPIAFLMQLAHCIVVLYRLTTLENPDWDLRLVKEVFDFGEMLSRLVERLEGIHDGAGAGSEGEPRAGPGTGSFNNGEAHFEGGHVHVDALGRGGNTVAIDLWISVEKRMRVIRNWWRARNGSGDSESNNNNNNNNNENNSYNNSDDHVAGYATNSGNGGSVDGDIDVSMEFWDDSWLDVIGLRDY